MLHAFFIKLAQHRSHPLVAPARCEDERLVCVGKLQHEGLTQLQLLKCILLFVAPLPRCILLHELIVGMGNESEVHHEFR